MEQFTKYYASYSEYGTTTTFGSVGRTLEVFFLEDQRDEWVEADEMKDDEPHREVVTLRQAGAILQVNGQYTVHEPDGTTWVFTKDDVEDPDMPLNYTLLQLASKVMPLEEQVEIELKKLKDTPIADAVAERFGDELAKEDIED